MGLSEVQQQFTAYGSGRLPALELRNCIRSALNEDPQLSLAFLALAEAYRRANLIDASLHSTINADIAEVTRPRSSAQLARTARSGGSNTGSFTDDPSIYPHDRAPLRVDPLEVMTRQAPSPAREVENRTAFAGETTVPSWEGRDPVAATSPPMYPGSVLRDRFVLLEQLGHGGMGVVYKAFDRSRGDVRDRYVAIKVLDEEFKRHPLAVWTLQRETRKAQKLAHPNIASVYDFDRDGSTVYMVMEFLSGRSLDQVIREEGRSGMALGVTLRIVKALGAALSYAHEQGIVHSDFKPSNAFLTHDGKVKVLDFGIARATPARIEKGDATQFDARQLGAISPTYASLEMLKGGAPDVRDDVYALACVIYEMLTGSHPYQRIDALKAHTTGLKPRVVRKLSRAQWRALRQGLAFERRDRSPSVDSLVSQLVAPKRGVTVWIAAAVVAAAIGALAGSLVWKWDEPRLAALRHAFTESRHLRAAAPAHVAPSPAPPRAPSIPPVDPHRELATVLSRPEATQEWAARLEYAVGKLGAVVPPDDPELLNARRLGAQTFVAAAAAARSGGRLDDAASLLGVARTLDPQSPEILAQSGELEQAEAARREDAARQEEAARQEAARSEALRSSDEQRNRDEERFRNEEMLKEKFETQAAALDVEGASATASSLERGFSDSPYVAHEMPRILTSIYLRLAKTQFAAGHVDDSLQILAKARRRFGRSQELKDLEMRYVAAADIYDRLSTAVTINFSDMQQSLDALRAAEGNEYDAAAQMLAQTLANRIADERAAGRINLADRLLVSGRRLFPSYSGILEHGTPGLLPNTPIIVDEQ
jgi:serine/threonine protein kinase